MSPTRSNYVLGGQMSFYARLGVAFLVLSTAAIAQSTYGVIYGSITDASSAVIKDSTVEAKNTDTGASRSLKTGADGVYRFVNLDPGSYTISAAAPGFSTAEKKNVRVTARDQIAVDLQLQVAGAAATTVEVTAAD